MIELLQSDDSTALDGTEWGNPQAGQYSDTMTVHLWNEHGNSSGSQVDEVGYLMQTEDPSRAGVYLSSGVPPQDELWGWGRIVGYDNTGDPAWSIANTDWQPLGAYMVLWIGTIPANCAVYLERRMRPPSNATKLTYRTVDTVIYSEHSRPVPTTVAAAVRGVKSWSGVPGHAQLLRGCDVSASATPDANVTIGAGLWQDTNGSPHGMISAAETLDQNDSASSALASGESYIALICLDDSGVAITKGAKAAAPTAPTTPVGEVLLAMITVSYQAGGTSIINAGDISAATPLGRFAVERTGVLQARVNRGDAIWGVTQRHWTGYYELAVSGADGTSAYLWQTAAGLYTTTTTATPPEQTAMLVARFDIASGDITVADQRVLDAGRTLLLRFSGATPASAGDELAALLIADPELRWEETIFRVSDQASLSGASAGQTQVDIKINGTSAYPSSGTEDLRPAVAYDSADLIDKSAIHETCTLTRDDVVSVELSELPSAGAPADLEVILVCRR